MRKIATVLAAATVAGALLPASAYAAEPHHARHHYRHHAYHHRYERAPAYVNDQAYYAQRPVYAATGLPSDPLLYPIGGAVIGTIIGAAVCPPCAIAGSALTSGGGALVGAGIGAIGGTLVGVAVTEPRVNYAQY
ncbi:hypothetical protein ASD45_02685 [Pseudolabrys sp. Root1462]|uniref:hypothetical protein n=1 Tax=Pseudolabrys sp. Root1462 TaxID=1736466 RepID=UPI00070328E4|nr:hypothetical protein [Pseudolabrys sp. Root1462]KQY99825.1 hypothetical protein ASD45_02685 [Pseudolabrys sp. Root1462]